MTGVQTCALPIYTTVDDLLVTLVHYESTDFDVPLTVRQGSVSGTVRLTGGAFGHTSGTVRGANAGGFGWSSTTSAEYSGKYRNGASASVALAADAFVDRIADRANTVENRSHDPPRYSCFVSFSSADETLVAMLVADLRKHGVKCWFAPDDLRIGEATRPAIAKAIQSHEKLLVVISKNSLCSPWVESEVEIAFAEERRRQEKIIFPIKLDVEISNHASGWAGDIQRMRNIGDLTGCEDQNTYQVALARILRDLVKA